MTDERDYQDVIVCGDIHWTSIEEAAAVDAVLDELHKDLRIRVLAQGGCAGAEWFASRWADKNAVQRLTFHDPFRRGKGSRKMRNAYMLEYVQPDLVIAFGGDDDSRDMVERAEAAGVQVRLV